MVIALTLSLLSWLLSHWHYHHYRSHIILLIAIIVIKRFSEDRQDPSQAPQPPVASGLRSGEPRSCQAPRRAVATALALGNDSAKRTGDVGKKKRDF